MRHRSGYKKLGRTSSHRRAMIRNQLASLIEHERIETTLAKAKAVRPVAEKLITQGRKEGVHPRRLVRRWISERRLVKRLFDEVAPRFVDRPGGYLRIVKLGPRRGDGAERAILEFVDYDFVAKDS